MQSTHLSSLPKSEDSRLGSPDKVASKRVRFYIFLSIFLAISYYFLSGITWETSSFFHSIIETTACMLAIIVGLLALVRYYAKKSFTYLFIAMGFLGAGLLDIYHTVVTTASIAPLFPSGIQPLFIWSWTASRSFLASFLFFSWLFWWGESWFVKRWKLETVEKFVYIISPIFMAAVFIIVLEIFLPSPYFSVLGITRPADAVAGIFFLLALFGYLYKGNWKKDEVEHWLIISILFFIATQVCMAFSPHIHDMKFNLAHFFKDAGYIAMLTGLLLSMFYLFKDSQRLNINLAAAQKELKQYSTNLEEIVAERTQDLAVKNQELESAVQKLLTTQNQLVTQEKLASLGALTAGIAHELKNPLNFVNNFSVLALRNQNAIEKIIDQYKTSLTEQDTASIDKLTAKIKENLTLVVDQGKRADTIIKRMLEHSRSEDAKAEPTDVNALLEEYIALAYHGMRAQDTSFNVTIEKDLDKEVGKLNIIASDISRVFLNILNNAFYAVIQKKKQLGEAYQPILSVTSKTDGKYLNIYIRDNGVGIPDYVLPKIFLPFFTTRPVGQGTGLGLSISHDIIVQEHKGQLSVSSKEGEFAEFLIQLPLK